MYCCWLNYRITICLCNLQDLKYNKQVTDEATKQQLDRLNDLQEEMHAHNQTNAMLKNELEAW